MTETTTTSLGEWAIISTYTRAQALADDVLVGADAGLSLEAGWRYPVAYTAAVHGAMIAWDQESDTDKGVTSGQDEVGRELDVLCMAARAAQVAPRSSGRIAFVVAAVPPTGASIEAVEVDLVVHIGPGDTPKPVVTIMFPTED